MDQNNQFVYSQEDPSFEQTRTVKNARYFRARAREILKGKWVMASVGNALYQELMSLGVMLCLFPMMLVFVSGALMDMFLNIPFVSLITFLAGYGMMFVGAVFIAGPLTVGYARMNLGLVDGQPVRIGSLFSCLRKGRYGNSVGIMAWMLLITFGFMVASLVGLFVCAFISGLLDTFIAFAVTFTIFMIAWFAVMISVFYRYIMAPFILAEYPEMRAIDAMRSSATLMKGRKWKAFCLELSFIGWILLYIPVTLLTCGAGIVGAFVLTSYMQASMAAFYHDAANRDASKDVEFPSINPDDYVAE